MTRLLSTKTVPTPVPAKRLFMSLLARDRSTTLAYNSALTVVSSSLTDCSSSLDVSSSSLVDCSSSFKDCISSLADFSSSLDTSSSSLALCRYSSLACSSWVSKAILDSTAAEFPFVLPVFLFTGKTGQSSSAADISSSTTRYRAGSVLSAVTGSTVRLTVVKSPLVLMRNPERATGSLFATALSRATVKSWRSPSRAVFKILTPISPEANSRNLPVRP